MSPCCFSLGLTDHALPWVAISPSGRLSMIISLIFLHHVKISSHGCCYFAVAVSYKAVGAAAIQRILHYLKAPLFSDYVSPIVHAVSGKYCCHCFCEYMSGLLGSWANKITCVYWSSSAQDSKSNHILRVKTGKHITLGWKQWPNPLILTDSMNAFLCVRAYDTYSQSGLCLCVMLGHMWQARSSWLMPVLVDV